MRRMLILCLALVGLSLLGCHMPTAAPLYTTPLPGLETLVYNPIQTETEQPAPSPTPTVLVETVRLTATVWEALPQVPILMYHRFDPRAGAYSSRYVTSLADFDQQLSALYEAGFSLVSLSDWLRGEINLPEGRRPLIITIDDLYYADQIFLDENGQPAVYSGVGRLWAFTQEHPDFNFAVSLFYNLGDKGYANTFENGYFTIAPGWREDRARVIAWGIEHGALPMNHFYEHPFLNQLSPAQIHWQLEENDRILREALASIGRDDLIPNLPNIIALPYVVWPETEAGKAVLYDYINPEGVPAAAIIVGDYAGGVKFAPSPFDETFSRWQISRISASYQSVTTIIEKIDQIPVASTCDLGEVRGSPQIMPEDIARAIKDQVNTDRCPAGFYIVHQLAFFMQGNDIIQYSP